MSNLNLVSILIPVYNGEKFLSKCLESVISQTYKNLEIICVNDGSTDGSLSVLKKYAKKDNRIKVFTKKNEGEDSTRNYLISKVTGKYFLFLDADDFLEKKAVEILLKTITKNDADLVEYSLNHIFIGNRKTNFNLKKFGKFSSEKYINFYRAICWNKFFKTQIVHENKINFPQDKKVVCGFDKFFSFEYISCSKNIVAIPDKLYNYIIHNSSTLSNMSRLQILSDFYGLNYCYDFLHEKKLFKKFHTAFLNKANKLKNKLVNGSDFFADANNQIKKMNGKIRHDYPSIYFKYKLKSILSLKNIFSIQSSIDRKFKVIKIFGFQIIKGNS